LIKRCDIGGNENSRQFRYLIDSCSIKELNLIKHTLLVL